MSIVQPGQAIKAVRYRRQQGGFTLIELIAVIVILGILSATALPKFIDLRSDARIAKMKSFAGALHGGVNLAVARWRAAGSPAGGIVVGTRTILFTPNGYPTAGTVQYLLEINYGANANGVYPMTSGSTTTFCNVENSQVDCGTAWPPALNDVMGGAFDKCAFTYSAPTTTGAAYTIDSSSYLTAGNCT